jgi:hypothetical protein
MFFAPWAEKYLAFVGDWAAIASELGAASAPKSDTGSATSFRFAKIDAIAHPEVATKFRIPDLPTIYTFQKGRSVLYEGRLDRKSFGRHLRRMNSPAVVDLLPDAVTSVDAYQRQVPGHRDDVTAVVAFFESRESLAEVCGC